MLTLVELQLEVGPWQRSRWPMTATQERTAMKLGEEAGEVLGAVVKLAEGRCSLRDLANEFGDVAIALAACADLHGITLADAVERRWRDDVRHR